LKIEGASSMGDLIASLTELERAASVLEPDGLARAALTAAALAHVERLLSAPSPAYAPDVGSADALAELPIGPEPAGLEKALAYLARHVDSRGHGVSAPGFFGYIPGGNLYHAALADLLAAVSNRFTGHLMANPGAVRIENQALGWLASVVGYPATAAGNFTSGGSLANLAAVVSAREALQVRARDVERTVVYLTAHAHHCVTKALRLAGLSECIRREVATDRRHRMRPDALEAAIAADLRDRRRPWLVVASAGTTDTGAVDPLDAAADVAARHRLWLHVDAAYGGMFALCEAGRAVLRGIERSDSVVLDPHKGMLLPYGVGAVIVKDRAAMMAAHAFEAGYIVPELRNLEEVSPTEHSAELSRPFRGLRVWLPLQALGTRPFAAAVEEKLLLARYAHERLGRLRRVELGPEPELSLFVFRAVPERGSPDAFNDAVERTIRADGRAFLSSTTVDGRRWLRFAVLAIGTHRSAVDAAIARIDEAIAQCADVGRAGAARRPVDHQ
jgi:glutamate/tyrosine decarboxylase-like PLP-dependent enzyme